MQKDAMLASWGDWITMHEWETIKKVKRNSEIRDKCKKDQICNFIPDMKSYEEPDYADNAIS